MEENVNDQGQEAEVSETEAQASEEQSETTDVSEETSKDTTYRLIDKDLTADELYDYAKKQQAYVTKMEQEKLHREAQIQEEVAEAVSENELLQSVDPNVKEAITQIVTPVIQSALRDRDEKAAKEAKDRELRQSFDNAESKYDGKDGYPKFSRSAVTNFMLENEVYDPEKAYLLMNQAAIIDAEVRKALKGGKPSSTESTAGSTPRKPQGKPASSFEEASKRAASRI